MRPLYVSGRRGRETPPMASKGEKGGGAPISARVQCARRRGQGGGGERQCTLTVCSHQEGGEGGFPDQQRASTTQGRREKANDGQRTGMKGGCSAPPPEGGKGTQEDQAWDIIYSIVKSLPRGNPHSYQTPALHRQQAQSTQGGMGKGNRERGSNSRGRGRSETGG